MMQSNPDRLLTPEQAAELLQVSTRTIYGWLRAGEIPGTQIGGRLWRLREGDILTNDVRSLLESGLKCDARCEVEEGAVAFRKSLELNPHYNLANFCLGNMYYRWSHYHRAVEPLRKAIELNPEWVAPYGVLGMNYNYWGLYSEAEPVLRKAIELVPNHADSYYHLGFSLTQQFVKDGEAITAFRKAVELNPTHLMASSFLGDVLIRQGDFIGAKEVYDNLKGLNERFAEDHLRKLEWARQQYLPRRIV